MPEICRHCATPFSAGSGVDGFCCAGCREVHALICQEGLNDFYRKQDRVAEPLKDRELTAVDRAAFAEVQRSVEGAVNPARAAFSVSGMSCMGCVWLIGRLVERQSGNATAELSLTRQSLELTWEAGQFNLGSLAEELRRFGYRIDAKPLVTRRRDALSPLALRLLLSLLFTGNALLLAVYSFVAGSASLVDLLSLGCLGFTTLLGATPFFQTVYGAARIRRWHSDWLPSLIIAGAWAAFCLNHFFGIASLPVAAFAVCLVISSFVLSRFLANRLSRRST